MSHIVTWIWPLIIGIRLKSAIARALPLNKLKLVGGWATPLKNMSSSIGMMKATQYFWENKKLMATKPPTSWRLWRTLQIWSVFDVGHRQMRSGGKVLCHHRITEEASSKHLDFCRTWQWKIYTEIVGFSHGKMVEMCISMYIPYRRYRYIYICIFPHCIHYYISSKTIFPMKTSILIVDRKWIWNSHVLLTKGTRKPDGWEHKRALGAFWIAC